MLLIWAASNLKVRSEPILGQAMRNYQLRNILATEGKALVASLLSAVAGCWRETIPQALAALGLSPSKYNSCLLRERRRTIQSVQETDGWRQYLEEHDISEQEAEQKSSRDAACVPQTSNN
jgi:hypothetical protein